jgi:hypothetical protein
MKLWCSFLFPSSVFYDCKGCEAIGLGEKPFLRHFRYMEDQIDVQFLLGFVCESGGEGKGRKD